MLIELEIHNIALIESLCIRFERGFNVLTGETGSGKSIVVDCMNLVLGGRSDKGLIRSGTQRGYVQALFDVSGNPRAAAFAESCGVDCSEGTISILRELNTNGRNICRISGIILPLNTLKKLTGLLFDIHGQHEHQSLMDPAMHIDYLDSYGDAKHHELRQKVGALYAARQQIDGQLKQILHAARDKERLMDVLKLQTDEIEAARLKPGEEERLMSKLRVIEHSERIQASVEEAYALVYQGTGKTSSAQETLQRAQMAMQGIASLDARYEKAAGRLQELYYAAQDIGYELQDIREHLEFDPKLAEKLNRRMALIDRLERKYGPTVDDVIAFGENARRQMEAYSNQDAEIEALKKRLDEADTALNEAAQALSDGRASLAGQLSAQIMEQLSELGMQKTRFSVRMERQAKPGPNGFDEVEFLISPNPGEPLKPLAAIASGGELSRIMLAMKAISMKADGIDAMVFDEIDTGVSGRMAQVVGEKMCRIARDGQVICVTHLPQIAALGDAQYLVRKEYDGERTNTTVERLDHEGRVLELSRLVGSARDSQSGRDHAEQMLADAREVHAAINAAG